MRSDEDLSELVAGPDDEGRRLDKVLRAALPRLGLSEIYRSLRKGEIRVNDSRASPDTRLREGDRIALGASALVRGALEAAVDAGAGLEGGIDDLGDILVLRTEHLIFINKPRGELSQGPGSIEDRLRSALARRAAASLSFSPGPLHRLDRNTSGLMAFPATAKGARAFTGLMRERKIRKLYIALLDGELEGPAEWLDRIERDEESLKSRVSSRGEEASALASPLARAGGSCLALVELRTGLTHQIRVQASSRGLPLSGDRKYGGRPIEGGYILHAFRLGFPEPPFPDIPASVTAPLPEAADIRLKAIFGRAALGRALDRALELAREADLSGK